MFLSPDHKKLLWRRIAVAAAIVVALVFAGIFWLDIPIYKLLRHLDWVGWGWLGAVTGIKVWLTVSCAIFVIFSGTVIFKKILADNKDKSSNKRASVAKRSKFISFLINFLEKTNLSAVIFTNNFKSKKWFEKIANVSFAVFASVALSGALTWLLKGLVGRARPIIFDFWERTGFAFGTFGNDYYDSMPSGHATAAFAGLVVLGMLFPRAKPYTWMAATVVAISRIPLGAHWPSDILAGAFIGMLAADIILYITNKGIGHK
ncbi:hypothetical protein FACS189421_09360 [Bacteroidia bacterium]|nr:hypothetical protein FACS189421_09360 [Bacteroidia bacterium]